MKCGTAFMTTDYSRTMRVTALRLLSSTTQNESGIKWIDGESVGPGNPVLWDVRRRHEYEARA